MMTYTAHEAASKIGISVRQFMRAVYRGELPGPILHCRPPRWSEKQIQEALAGRSTKPHHDGSDPITERINAVFNEVR